MKRKIIQLIIFMLFIGATTFAITVGGGKTVKASVVTATTKVSGTSAIRDNGVVLKKTLVPLKGVYLSYP